ncbi:MAG: thiol protease/hemagglutinin PrtT [Bacteroidales bacterium]|nr:thiol protease/hemagglutinin PrtT [Bacteroidales bacterium]
MKRLLVLPLLFSLHILLAAPIGPDNVRKNVSTFMAQQLGKTAQSIQLCDISNAFGLQYVSIYNILPHGFAVAATDDCAQPILAYDTHESIDTASLSPELCYWLKQYDKQIAYGIAHGYGKPVVKAAKSDSDLPRAYPVLLTSRWDQSPYINKYCPVSATSGRVMTGCGATAMAQVLRYWKWPEHGYGAIAYDYTSGIRSSVEPWRFGRLSLNFSTVFYQWDIMPDRVNSNSAETDAAALLAFHSGMAAASYYDLDGAGSSGSDLDSIEQATDGLVSNVLDAIKWYFGYQQSAQSLRRDETTDSLWTRLLKVEISRRRPVIYGGYGGDGSGHAFVLDGYDANNRFHINWGWSGAGNGYFALAALSVYGDDYSHGQTALVGLSPDYSLRNVFTVSYDDNTFVLRCTITNAAQHLVEMRAWERPGNVLPENFQYPDSVEFNGSTYYRATDPVNPPSDTTIIPQDSTVVPQDSTIRPQDSTIVPQDTTVVPQDSTLVPQDSTVVPQDSTLTPSLIGAVNMSSVKVYPNPARQLIVVEYDEAYSVELVNAAGKIVDRKEHTAFGKRTTFYLSHVPSGIYQVRVFTPQGVMLRRIVVVSD